MSSDPQCELWLGAAIDEEHNEDVISGWISAVLEPANTKVAASPPCSATHLHVPAHRVYTHRKLAPLLGCAQVEPFVRAATPHPGVMLQGKYDASVPNTIDAAIECVTSAVPSDALPF